MGEKARRIKGKKFRKVAGEVGNLRVIKVEKTRSGDRIVTISKKIIVRSTKGKMPLLKADLTSNLTALPSRLQSKDDLDSGPPENPNRRPTRINADRSLSRMKARDRSLVGRGY